MNGTEVNPATAQNCTKCGARLPAGALAGLCPACLLQQGAVPDTLTGPAAHPFEPPPVAELAPLFPQLEILALLGKGGMGAVYQARQKQLDRWVALKILPPAVGEDPAFAERFTREARALARLNHPGIVTLYEFGCVQNRLYYFLMEFVDGVNLRQLLAAGRISPREALGIVPQICDALQFAHDQGVVHRDIKPENILLDRRGRVKVADFGLAKLARGEPESRAASLSPAGPAALTGMGQVMGTPNYMAPEQLEHPADVDHRADIYALGVVFYQMLTGELPGKGLEPPSTKVRVDVRLDAVVLRALERNPELRYQQVSEIKTAVETLGADPSATPVPTERATEPAPSAATEAARRTLRRPANALLLLGAAGLALCCLTTSLGFANTLLHLTRFAGWNLPSAVFHTVLLLGTLFPALNLAIVVGALRMRALEDLGLARAAAACAMLAPPLMPLGLVLGARTLLRLRDPGIRHEFHAFTPPSQPRLSRLAVACASLAITPVLTNALVTAVAVLGIVDFSVGPPGWGQKLLSVFLVQPWWTVTAVLGAVAFEDIRRSQGRLRGAAPAAFGLLFGPCQFWLLRALCRPRARLENLSGDSGILFISILAALLPCTGLALWIQRHETRRRQGSSTHLRPHCWWLSSPALRSLQALAAIPILSLIFSLSHWLLVQQPWTAGQPRTQEAGLSFLAAHLQATPGYGPSAAGHFTVPLPGGEVEVLAVSDVAAPELVCWQPDGAVLWRTDNPAPDRPKPSSAAPTLILALRVGKPPQTLRLDLAPPAQEASPNRLQWEGGDLLFIPFTVPPDAGQLTLRLGVESGEWQDTDIGWDWGRKFRPQGPQVIRRSGQRSVVTLGQVTERPGHAFSAGWWWQAFPRGWFGRLVAVDESGGIHEGKAPLAPIESMGAGEAAGEQVWFEGVDLARIREFRLQLSPCRWVEVQNVSLRPGVRTQVKVVQPAEMAPRPTSSRQSSTLQSL